MDLTVDLIRDESRITEQDIRDWNRLAANPFQQWQWLGNWWRAYRNDYSLRLLFVRRQGKLVGVAPWCMRSRVATGQTLEFLGSGKACTDHLSVLVRPEDARQVCDRLASWLIEQSRLPARDATLPWDAIEFDGIEQNDRSIGLLQGSFVDAGLIVENKPGMPRYEIDLPETWEDYLSLRSKSGRREVRQSLGPVDDGSILISRSSDATSLEKDFATLVELHQSRRHSLGTKGCFDFPNFDRFLLHASQGMLDAGLLQFYVASVEGVPIAALLGLADSNCFYYYQSGMTTTESRMRPGLSLLYNAIRESIQCGRRRFDLMRGDESYKSRMLAEPRGTIETRVFGGRRSSVARGQIYKAGLTLKNMVKGAILTPPAGTTASQNAGGTP